MWQVWPFAQQEPAVSSSCHICGAAHAKGNVASWSMSGQWTCTDCEGYRAELAAKAQPSAEERLRRREEYFRKNPA